MSEMVKASGLFHHNLVMAAGRNSSLCDKFCQCPVDGERFGGALAMFSCWQGTQPVHDAAILDCH
jgi:hypothetical protein